MPWPSYNRNLFSDVGLPDRTPEIGPSWSLRRAYRPQPDGSPQCQASRRPELGRPSEHGLLLSLSYPLGGRLLSDGGRGCPCSQANVDALISCASRRGIRRSGNGTSSVCGRNHGHDGRSGPSPVTSSQRRAQRVCQHGHKPLPARAGHGSSRGGLRLALCSQPRTPSADGFTFLTGSIWSRRKPVRRMGNVLAHLRFHPRHADDLRNQEACEPFMVGFVEPWRRVSQKRSGRGT